ncbi:putative terminase, large subunit [Edwardsiella phage KF-1]|uniref:Putative terminase, large subunit n=2 Tax=Edwardsiella phage KF-1 TaxID=1244856 RepID=K4PWS9_9CAUD|nr:putative terminase, large subunit [Edwardsiella phage KF-1]BAM63050.1 putative terminase, large subunit [Edwardsiella phage KF-1]BAM63098.1 putative terminase, large subunit [Edwardsiella phage IW-1]
MVEYGLTINEQEFNEIYPDLVGHYAFFNEPPPSYISTQDFERQYLANKLWRLNHIYTIVNKSGAAVQFKMNKSQHRVYGASRKHKRVIILKSRQQGISTFWLVSYFDDGVFCKLLNIGMMAQGVDEAASLLERSKFIWDHLSPDIKRFANIGLDKDNLKEFSFTNGSKIFIRVSFRSTTLQRLHISEMGKIANQTPQRAKEVKTGTLQALYEGNTGVIESTAEGMNMFKEMWDQAELALHSGAMTWKDFYPVFLSWLEDPDCAMDVDQESDSEAIKYFAELEDKVTKFRRAMEVTAPAFKLTRQQKNFWLAQRRELGGDIFQEYPATPEEAFTASRDGTYWGRQFRETVVRNKRAAVANLHDPNLPTDVFIDIGVEDYGVLVFRQWYRGEYRIIDEYFNQNYDMAHYMDEAMSRGYNITTIVFPHDIKVREYSGGNSGAGGEARTRLDIAEEKVRLEGWDVRIDIAPKLSIADGIEAVRRIIPKLIIDARCKYLTKCFQRYTKEWDEKLQAWKKTEVHNEWSHGAAALRYMATYTSERGLVAPHKMRVKRGEYCV